MNKFFISIVIPVFNVEEYLSACVNSVINQTYKDIEIILVDDGSTDNSGIMCDEFKEKDNRIKVIHKENGGLSSARNAGVERSTGDYVLFLDGDDYLRKDAVERLVGVLTDYPSDMIQFEYIEVDNHEGDILQQTDCTVMGEVFQAFTPKEFFYYLYQKGGVYASGCTKLYKAELIKRIPFCSIRHEDEMWCTQAFQNNMTVTYIPDILYYYVVRDNSIIHSRFSRSKLDSFRIRETRIEVLQDLGFSEYVSIEYKKCFSVILSLYHEARREDDQEALQFIRKKFFEHKENIARHANLNVKFRLLFKLMQINYSAIYIYDWYWTIIKKS